MTRFELSIELYDLPPVFRELTAAAVLSAGGSEYERFVGEIVHRIHRIPCAFVAQADGARCSRNRAVFVDTFQQFDAMTAQEAAALVLERQSAAHTERRAFLRRSLLFGTSHRKILAPTTAFRSIAKYSETYNAYHEIPAQPIVATRVGQLIGTDTGEGGEFGRLKGWRFGGCRSSIF